MKIGLEPKNLAYDIAFTVKGYSRLGSTIIWLPVKFK